MPTDWEWFWSSESGRDRLLRGEIEGLQASASSARSQSARLSSQLTQLQGSIETRLTALSTAFDAYVELGDVREQLAGYPDTAAVRRDAMDAIDLLSRGVVPGPIDDRGQDYWLSYAVDAVIALVDGRADPAADRRAVELSPDAELFIVAAAGALGQGAVVASRVPALLTCDGTLNPRQVIVWRAVRAGVYGAILPSVAEVWRSALDQSETTWLEWLREQGGYAAPSALAWLDRQIPGPTDQQTQGATREPAVTPPPRSTPTTETAAAPTDPRSGLRTVVIDLVGQGMGEEAELLARSRSLRARIENPTLAPAVDAAEAPGRPVTAEVQDALVEAGVDEPARRELLDWVRPGLSAAVQRLAEAAAVNPAVLVEVSTPAGQIDVSDSGAEPLRVAELEQRLADLNASPTSRVVTPVVVAGAAAVLALITVLSGHPRGALALLLAAVVAGAITAYMVRDRRMADRRRRDQVTLLHQQLEDGQERAVQRRRAEQQTAAAAAELAARIQQRLQRGGGDSEADQPGPEFVEEPSGAR